LEIQHLVITTLKATETQIEKLSIEFLPSSD
jgi:hypothetical protein